MSIADKLTVLAASKEMVRLKLGIGEDVPFSEYSDHIGWDGITSDLGQSTTTAASQKLVTDEVDKAKDREALLQTSITAILDINKKLTNRINVLEESKIYEMFKNSDGVWLDPSDLKTIFQDSNGIIPVTKDGDPVGLILDKSKGLELGEELAPKTKEGFVWLNGVPSEDITNNLPQSVESAGSQIAFNIRGFDPEKRYRIVLDIDTVTGTRLYYRGTTPDVIYLPTGRSKRVIYTKPNDRGYLAYIFSTGANNITIYQLSIKEIKGNHASQSLAVSRPTYNTTPSSLVLDKVDDAYVINMPKRIVGSMILATATGTATYGVDIPAGSFTLRGNLPSSTDIVGLVIKEGVLSGADETTLTNMFVGKGAVESFESNTTLNSAFKDWRLTSFPLIDTSSVTSFNSTWQGNNLTSFPLIDTSRGTSFYSAWQGNVALVNFPKNMFDDIKGGHFGVAFNGTNLNQESIDGILVSLVTSGIASGTRIFDQSGGSAPSAIGQAAIDTLRSRGWTVTVTGGY